MKAYRLRIGVLALQGDVREHLHAASCAAEKQHIPVSVEEVRTRGDLDGLEGLIIPGGESTVLYKLTRREAMFDKMRHVPCILGTCAGAIMLAKTIHNKEKGQESLGLMNIEATRNAYGRQTDSFETVLDTSLGTLQTVFIRAPQITPVSPKVRVLAKKDTDVVACEESGDGRYYLALTFHPELTTDLFHSYFIRHILAVKK